MPHCRVPLCFAGHSLESETLGTSLAYRVHTSDKYTTKLNSSLTAALTRFLWNHTSSSSWLSSSWNSSVWRKALSVSRVMLCSEQLFVLLIDWINGSISILRLLAKPVDFVRIGWIENEKQPQHSTTLRARPSIHPPLNKLPERTWAPDQTRTLHIVCLRTLLCMLPHHTIHNKDWTNKCPDPSKRSNEQINVVETSDASMLPWLGLSRTQKKAWAKLPASTNPLHCQTNQKGVTTHKTFLLTLSWSTWHTTHFIATLWSKPNTTCWSDVSALGQTLLTSQKQSKNTHLQKLVLLENFGEMFNDKSSDSTTAILFWKQENALAPLVRQTQDRRAPPREQIWH